LSTSNTNESVQPAASGSGAMTKRRLLVYLILFAMTAVMYTDRVNLSVAAGMVRQEFNLSPAELGWLLSAYLWPYIICLTIAGLLVDRFGYRVVGAAAVGFWSLATACTGFIGSLSAFYACRVGLGIGEAANFPIGTGAVRAWAPRKEYGFAVASLSLGQWFGTAFGALFVGWIVATFGWRAAFVVTGVLGFIWVAIWWFVVRDPTEARWLPEEERKFLIAERDAKPAQQTGGADIWMLLRSRSLWAVAIAQGGFVYEAYMLLSWLPNFLQTQHHISIAGSGLYTFIIYGTAVIGSILLARFSDWLFPVEAMKKGARKWVVAFSYLPAMLVAVVPQVESIGVIVLLLAISVTFLANGVALNTALCNDLVRRPADAATAIALFTAIANVVGVGSPIVTGYAVGATGNFNMAFVLTGVALLIGVGVLLGMIRGGIGPEQPAE
jgi:MFS transporter, ACS family, D-galactonate transporter